MHPDERQDSPTADNEIHIEESAISSLLAHYYRFEETLGMNTARGMVRHNIIQSQGTQRPKFNQFLKKSDSTDDSNELDIKPNKLILAAMPAYNEEKTIAKMIIRTKKFINHILIVDDGSTDATAEIAEALGAYVIRHGKNKGYGAALQTIFDTARILKADTLVILDSDDQHDPADIPSLLKPLSEGYDIVIGSRFIGNNGNHIPAYRIVGMKILDTATKIAGNIELSDTQSGFRAYGKNAINSIRLSGQGMSAGSEILLHAKDHNLAIKEIPISVKYNVEKPSTHNPFAHGLSVLGNIIGIIGYRKPLITFGIPGAILTLLGAGMSVYTVTELYTGGAFHSVIFVSGITFLILGLLLVTTSLILNSLVQVVKMERV